MLQFTDPCSDIEILLLGFCSVRNLPQRVVHFVVILNCLIVYIPCKLRALFGNPHPKNAGERKVIAILAHDALEPETQCP
jgi:hypothetical protein